MVNTRTLSRLLIAAVLASLLVGLAPRPVSAAAVTPTVSDKNRCSVGIVGTSGAGGNYRRFGACYFSPTGDYDPAVGADSPIAGTYLNVTGGINGWVVGTAGGWLGSSATCASSNSEITDFYIGPGVTTPQGIALDAGQVWFEEDAGQSLSCGAAKVTTTTDVSEGCVAGFGPPNSIIVPAGLYRPEMNVSGACDSGSGPAIGSRWLGLFPTLGDAAAYSHLWASDWYVGGFPGGSPPPDCGYVSFSADVAATDQLATGDLITFELDIPADVTVDWFALDFDSGGAGVTSLDEFEPNPIYQSTKFANQGFVAFPGYFGVVGMPVGYPQGAGSSTYEYDETPTTGPVVIERQILFPDATGQTLLASLIVECKMANQPPSSAPYTGPWDDTQVIGRACERLQILAAGATGGNWLWNAYLRSGAEGDVLNIGWYYGEDASEDAAASATPTWLGITIDVADAGSGTAFGEIDATISIAQTNGDLRSGFHFVCEDDDGILGLNPVVDPEGGDVEGCFGTALDGLKLTSPRTWVAGAGRMGVCVVRWLVIPSNGFVGQWAQEQRDTLSDVSPFSFGVRMIDFGSDVATEVQSPSGDACFTMGIPVGDVSTSEMCVGENISTSGAQRNLIAMFVIVPLLLGLLARGFMLLRSS